MRKQGELTGSYSLRALVISEVSAATASASLLTSEQLLYFRRSRQVAITALGVSPSRMSALLFLELT